MKTNLSIALIHYPVVDRMGDKVTTNVTNFDIHDIARAAQVYAVSKYFIVTPMREQLMFVARNLDHWRVGFGLKFNPMRSTSLDSVRTAESLDEVLNDLGAQTTVVATSAKSIIGPNGISFRDLREQIRQEKNILLLFGTGFGLHTDILQKCDYFLEPIKGVGPQDYRHLSVRSAVSICLDRLVGTW